MILIIGGYAQGKLDYVLKKHGQDHCEVWDAMIYQDREVVGKRIVFYHFHQWVKECLAHGGCPETECRNFLEKYPDCIVISDEIGNGIVPVDAKEREYRERNGRILVEIASQAQEVERVICGIGQRIK